jgi:hypothetical protein
MYTKCNNIFFFGQNEAQLSDLKKQLEQDTQTLKAKANVLTIHEVSCN